MMNDNKPSINYWGQVGILIGLFCFAAVVAALVQMIFYKAMGGSMHALMKQDMNGMIELMAKPENITKARLSQMIGTLILFIIPSVGFLLIVKQNGFRFLPNNKQQNWQLTALSIVLAFAAMRSSELFTTLNHYIPISKSLQLKFTATEALETKATLALANLNSFGEYLFALVVIALCPAIFEEVFFRGIVQQLLEKWSGKVWLAIVLTGLIFSVAHFSFYGFLARWFLGIVLGFVFSHSKNILLNILMHFINNATIITLLFIANKNNQPLDKMLTEAEGFSLISVVAFAVAIVLLQLFKRIARQSAISNTRVF